jgi:predicted amidohydrolase
MSNPLKVAAIQMDCVLSDVPHNLQVAGVLTGLAAEMGAVVVVVPELFDTGYRVEENDHELATSIPGPTTNYMTAICKKKNIFVVGTQIERTSDGLYDTAFLTGPNGLVGIYRKIALWGKEVDRFKTGDRYPVFDIGVCRIGLQICYEIGFPEGARILTMQGADVIAYPSAFGAPRQYAWDLASRARALENGCYVIACNRFGREKNETVFAANSRVVNPRGEVLATSVGKNDVIMAEIDLEMVKRQREEIPYLRDLRKDLVCDYFGK